MLYVREDENALYPGGRKPPCERRRFPFHNNPIPVTAFESTARQDIPGDRRQDHVTHSGTAAPRPRPMHVSSFRCAMHHRRDCSKLRGATSSRSVEGEVGTAGRTPPSSSLIDPVLYGVVTAAVLSLLLVGPALASSDTTATVTSGALSITNPLAATFVSKR